MTVRVQVTRVTKSDRYSPHERITKIGGEDWTISQSDAIQYIKDKKYNFYVMAAGKTVDVIVATRLGHEYLKTIADGETPDNLLSLPPCK